MRQETLDGSMLRKVRIKRGASIAEAARAASLREAEWRSVEKGWINPSNEMLRQMASVLGIEYC